MCSVITQANNVIMNDPMFVFCFVIVKIIMPEIKEMYKINKRCESNEFMAFYKEKFNCSLGNYKFNGI